MDEHFYLAICFVVFVILVIKPSVRTISSFLTNAQIHIKQKIDDAEKIYKEAGQQLLNAQKAQKELSVAIDLIKEKSKEEVAYDMAIREKTFEKDLQIKDKQLDNVIHADLHYFKLWVLENIKQNFQAKIVAYFDANKDSANIFTEKMFRS